MQYRRMGDSDLEVSAIGFGAWEVGGQYGSYVEQEFVDAVQQALDLGVTLFDTALAYGAGRSEALLGDAAAHLGDDLVDGPTQVRLVVEGPVGE